MKPEEIIERMKMLTYVNRLQLVRREQEQRLIRKVY